MGGNAQRRTQAVNAARSVLVGAEAGAVHSSDKAANHRGAKGPHLVNANSAAKDW